MYFLLIGVDHWFCIEIDLVKRFEIEIVLIFKGYEAHEVKWTLCDPKNLVEP